MRSVVAIAFTLLIACLAAAIYLVLDQGDEGGPAQVVDEQAALDRDVPSAPTEFVPAEPHSIEPDRQEQESDWKPVPEPAADTGRVVVRVLTRAGSPVRMAWTLRLEQIVADPWRQSVSIRLGTEATGTGVCTLEKVAVGSFSIRVDLDSGHVIQGNTVVVRAGETTHVDLLHDGPDPSRQIQLLVGVKSGITIWPERASIWLEGGGIERRNPEPDPLRQNRPVFQGLPTGVYSVVVEDSRYLPFRRNGIATGGERVSVLLTGSSGLLLQVRDQATGAPVRSLSIALEPKERWIYPRSLGLLEAGQEWPVGGRFEGLVAASYDLVLDSPDHAVLRLPLDDLQPGEFRAVSASLSAGGILEGAVFQADGAAPAVAQRVELSLTAPVGDGPELPAGHPGGRSSAAIWERAAHGRKVTDETGRFRFTRLAPGQYQVRAALTASLVARTMPLELAAGQTLSGIRLVLPAGQFLFGRLLAAPATDFGGVELYAFPVERASTDMVPAERQGIRAELDAVGNYRVGPLPAGPVAVRLLPGGMLDSRGPAAGSSRPWLDLGRAVLAEGEDLEQDFDLRGRMPGKVTVEVLVDGEPAVGIDLSAHRLDHDRAGGVRKTVDGAGLAELMLLPGSWRFIVGSAREGWYRQHPQPLSVASDSTHAVRIEIILFEADLTFLDETSGQPLAGQPILLMHDLPAGRIAVSRRTDASGRLRFSHPEGMVEVQRMIFSSRDDVVIEPRPVRVRWTRHGPEPAVLHLP